MEGINANRRAVIIAAAPANRTRTGGFAVRDDARDFGAPVAMGIFSQLNAVRATRRIAGSHRSRLRRRGT
jgi:hypothetical protein